MFTLHRFSASPFGELSREIERLFDDLGAGLVRSPLWRSGAWPTLNAWDSGEALFVEAEVPGVGQDDLEISAIGNELTIKGRREAMEGQDLTCHRRERGTGDFTRVLTLPAEIDSDKVEAQLKDGVLTLRLPKAESAKPRKITVNAN